jgi:CDP-glucose 4,6-dehydratase
LHGYLILAKKLWEHPELAGAYNFGPNTHEVATVREVIKKARQAFGCGDIVYGDGNNGLHEAGCLALETSKAREMLGASSKWSLTESINRTMFWYVAQQQGEDARSLCEDEISSYEADS